MKSTAGSAVASQVKWGCSPFGDVNPNPFRSNSQGKVFSSSCAHFPQRSTITFHENSQSRSWGLLESKLSYSRSSIEGDSICLSNQKRKPVVGRTQCAGSVAGVCRNVESSDEAPSHATEEKIGVLLLNLGGPDKLDDVQPFLYNLFADPDIIRLPRLFKFLQRPLAKLISTLRASKSKEGYAAIGGGSPLRKITDEQAQALKMALKADKLDVNVYVGMRYWYPFTEEAIRQIEMDRITKLVVLPLYPQFSISTTGSSLRVLQNMFREDPNLSRLPVAVINSWYQRQGYINAMADLIEKELRSFSNPDEVMIFFSAHGVPVSYVEEAGDPYRDQMEDCIFLIMRELKARGVSNAHTLAYQSRVGPVQWLKPYTDEVLVELGQKGVKSLLAVPVSFVSEHIETLEEIDMEYKELALESGIQNWGRVPALNCNPEFIADLANAVVEALPSAQAIMSPPEKCGKSAEDEFELDPVKYMMKLFLGSFLAFVLLLSPRMVSAFKNNLL